MLFSFILPLFSFKKTRMEVQKKVFLFAQKGKKGKKKKEKLLSQHSPFWPFSTLSRRKKKQERKKRPSSLSFFLFSRSKRRGWGCKKRHLFAQERKERERSFSQHPPLPRPFQTKKEARTEEKTFSSLMAQEGENNSTDECMKTERNKKREKKLPKGQETRTKKSPPWSAPSFFSSENLLLGSELSIWRPFDEQFLAFPLESFSFVSFLSLFFLGQTFP